MGNLNIATKIGEATPTMTNAMVKTLYRESLYRNAVGVASSLCSNPRKGGDRRLCPGLVIREGVTAIYSCVSYTSTFS